LNGNNCSQGEHENYSGQSPFEHEYRQPRAKDYSSILPDSQKANKCKLIIM